MDVVGAISSVISLIQVSIQVLTRLKEYGDTHNESPWIITDRISQLQLLSSQLKLLETNRLSSNSDEGTKALAANVKRCGKQIEKFNKKLIALLPGDNSGPLERSWKATKSLLKESQMDELWRKVKEHHSLIAPYVTSALVRSISFPPESKCIYQVPSIHVMNFVARPRLISQIDVAFDSRPSDSLLTAIVILLGMGGQGKTQMALEYCRSAKRASNASIIFWVDASSRSACDQSITILAKQLDGEKQVFDESNPASEYVNRVLSECTEPWLLVFDNFDDPSKIPNLQSTFFPQSRVGRILVTSRHGVSEELGRTIRVDRMEETEATQLLLSSSKDVTEEDRMEAKEIVSRLGYLPLAIDQSRAYISNRKLPLSSFRDEFDDRKSTILRDTSQLSQYKKSLSEGAQKESMSVFTTWELSFSQLRDNDRSCLRDFLTLLAFFHPQGISGSLFDSTVAIVSDQAPPLAQFLRAGKWDQDTFESALVDMQNLSLIQFVRDNAGRPTITLHPLISEWLRLRLSSEAYLLHLCQALAIIEAYISSDGRTTLQFEERKIVLLHLRGVIDMVAGVPASDLSQKPGLDCEACLSFGRFYKECGSYEQSKNNLQQGIEGCEDRSRPMQRTTLQLMHELADVCVLRNELQEAEDLYNLILEEETIVFGADHSSTLGTIHSLGNIYKIQGREMEAASMWNWALSGKEVWLMNLEHRWNPERAVDVINSIGILHRKQGYLPKAEELYKRALVEKEESLGADHPSTLDTIHDLGVLYNELGRDEEAISMFERALTSRERFLGPEHGSTLETLHELGVVYGHNYHEQAEVFLYRALSGRNKVLGPKHPATLHTANALGRLLRIKGRYDDAALLHNRALAGFEASFGFDSPSALGTVMDLAELYHSQQRNEEAEALYARALKGYEKSLPTDHIETLQAIYRFGRFYDSTKQYVRAEELLCRAATGYEKQLGRDHVLAKKSSNMAVYTAKALGAQYKSDGKFEEAEKAYYRAMSRQEEDHGPESSDVLRTAESLALLYEHYGKLPEAETFYLRVLHGRAKTLGPDRFDTIMAASCLASFYQAQRRLEEAETMFKRAFASSENRNRWAEGTYTGANNLGWFYCCEDRLDEAEKILIPALRKYEKADQNDNSFRNNIGIPDLLHSVGVLHIKQGRLAPARTMLERALKEKEKCDGPTAVTTLDTAYQLGNLHEKRKEFHAAGAMYRRVLTGLEKQLGEDHCDVVRARDALMRVSDRHKRKGVTSNSDSEAMHGEGFLLNWRIWDE
ncbi:TPR-like protein [Ramaria rubella]|nr:TPR-like protein [Ramaria rubella]